LLKLLVNIYSFFLRVLHLFLNLTLVSILLCREIEQREVLDFALRQPHSYEPQDALKTLRFLHFPDL
jgi:hypothetical protein